MRSGVNKDTVIPSLAPPAHTRGNTTRMVLVVEDDEDIAETMVEILSEEGISSQHVANGLQALMALEDGLSPRLILLDLLMPVMTGWDFLAAMRASKKYRHIPVVLVSGVLSSGARKLVQAALAKPPTIDDLVCVVRGLLH